MFRSYQRERVMAPYVSVACLLWCWAPPSPMTSGHVAECGLGTEHIPARAEQDMSTTAPRGRDKGSWSVRTGERHCDDVGGSQTQGDRHGPYGDTRRPLSLCRAAHHRGTALCVSWRTELVGPVWWCTGEYGASHVAPGACRRH